MDNHPAVQCDTLFTNLEFSDIRTASPPSRKGVYVIRVKRRGAATDAIIEHVAQLVAQLNWPVVGNKIQSRISRLANISDCPIIYIGSAGTRAGSDNTLKGRYEEFSGRHTAMYPVWALLLFGWQLEYGWWVVDEPARIEAELKLKYRAQHNSKLPALVHM